jgi:hypothetical protein
MQDSIYAHSDIVKYRIFYAALLFIVAANAFDAVCTIGWVNAGLAIEANPLMAYLIEKSTLLFFVVKMIVVLTAVWILYLRRQARLTRCLVIPVAVVYVIVLAIHLSAVGPPVF